MNNKIKALLFAVIMLPLLGAKGCDTDADTALQNANTASEQFEVNRRVLFVNVIQDSTILEISGLCSVEYFPLKYDVICKDENGEMLVNKMGRSDNVTMVVQQLAPINVSTYRYRYIVKPSLIIPDLDIVVPGMEGNS